MMSCGRSRIASGIVSRPRLCAISVTLQHAAAEERDLAAVLRRQIENLLQAVDGRLKHEMTSRRSRANEQLFEPRPDRALALGVAGPVDVGRIRHQQQHAALAVIGERVQIEQFVVGGRRVHFEIAGVDDDAERGRDGQRHRSSRSSA